MSDLTQWNPNERLQMIADILRNTTNFLNKVRMPESVPVIGGIGLGDVTTGTSGNLFERMAYGEPILNHNANEGMFKDPQAILDTAFLPGVGTLTSALRKGGTKVATSGLDVGRRAIMENLGKGAAIASAATVSPLLLVDALRGVTKTVSKEAIPAVARMSVGGLQGAPLKIAALMSKAVKGHLGVPGDFEDILEPLRRLHPKLSDDEIAQGVERLSKMFDEKHNIFMGQYRHPNEHAYVHPTTGLNWNDLTTRDIHNYDDLVKAVFEGRIDPAKLNQHILSPFAETDAAQIQKLVAENKSVEHLQNFERVGTSDRHFSVLQDMGGWADAYDKLENMTKEQAEKAIARANAVADYAGTPRPYPDTPAHRQMMESWHNE